MPSTAIAAALHDDCYFPSRTTTVVEMASEELNRLMRLSCDHKSPIHHCFPPACHSMLMNIDGNNRCIDCGERNPQWAALSYGVLLCLKCSGRHRSLGVRISCVRSISMDDWSLHDVLTMLEGGNRQLQTFFSRHELCEETASEMGTMNRAIRKGNVTLMRYRTKAALFYRQQMHKHISKVIEDWPYRGRELSRRRIQTRTQRMKQSSSAPHLAH